MIRVLGRQTSGNVQKVLFLLEELGVAYMRADYGRQFGNTATAEYLAMNPNAKVPTLVHGDVVVWESHTILRYLAALHRPELHGSSPAGKTDTERWMDWLLAQVNALYIAVFKDSKKDPSERAVTFQASGQELAAQLAIAEGWLGDRRWFAGDDPTLADIALAPVLARCLAFPIDRPALPNLEGWMAAVEERPAFQIAVGNRDSRLATVEPAA